MESKRLTRFGWKPYFLQQMTLDEWDDCVPARVSNIQRDRIWVETEQGEKLLRTGKKERNLSSWLAVGDWILAEQKSDSLWLARVLERSSLLRRQAAGIQTQEQLLAANVDTAFLVMAVTQDYSLNRLQRYVLVARDAGVEPVVVLTKADLVASTEKQVTEITLELSIPVVSVNALDADDVQDQLLPWCLAGETVVLLGSSGVGKSTLTNTLLQKSVQNTDSIRASDGKGKHTTTSRFLVQTEEGLNVIDTPGMREVQLWMESGQVDEVFKDITEFAQQCRFRDCRHENEPGCAVQKAIQLDKLSIGRWQQYLKLQKEEAHHLRQEAGAQAQKDHAKSFSKMVKAHPSEKIQFKKGKF